MKFLLTMLAFTSISGFACEDLSGSYEFNIEKDCTKESTEAILEPWEFRSSRRVFLLGQDGEERFVEFDRKKSTQTIRIEQNDCEEIKVTIDGYNQYNPEVPAPRTISYKIKEKHILEDGFKFKFNQNGCVSDNIFPICQVNARLNLTKESNGDVYYKSRYFQRILFTMMRKPALDCRLHLKK